MFNLSLKTSEIKIFSDFFIKNTLGAVSPFFQKIFEIKYLLPYINEGRDSTRNIKDYLKGKKELSSDDKNLLKTWEEKLKKYIKEQKITHILLPPTKSNGNHIKDFLSKCLKTNKQTFNNLIDIEISSNDYNLSREKEFDLSTEQEKEKRIKKIKEVYSSWKLKRKLDIAGEHKIIFIDDVMTHGTTLEFLIKFLKEKNNKIKITSENFKIFVLSIVSSYFR